MKASLKTGQDSFDTYTKDLAERIVSGKAVIMINYPDKLCPHCQKNQGFVDSVCHLQPSKSDPSSVFINFLACYSCYSKLNKLKADEVYKEAKCLVKFFDNWLELEYSQRRGEA